MAGGALWVALVGCGWNHLPHGSSVFLDPLWIPEQVVSAADGVYVPLARSGGLVRVARGEEAVTAVDVGEGRVERVDPTPGGDGVVALIERVACASDDDLPKRDPTVEDCPEDARLRSTEIAVVRGAEVQRGTALEGTYNAVELSEDGSFAVAWLDLTRVDDVDDVVNLTGVAVLDVVSGQSVLVSVGFAPERVLFARDDRGNTVRAVVLSRNEVALIELAEGPPRRSVTFPLTLDAADTVVPQDVALTPDGTKALVTARGRADLYVLDLEDPSVNIVELAGAPSHLAVVPEADLTAVVFQGVAELQLVDHASFGSRHLALGEPMDRVVVDPGRLVLHGRNGQHDLYRYDLADDRLTTYRVQNPVETLQLSPDGGFAVATTRAEAGGGNSGADAFYDRNPGMEIVDLSSDESTPFLLEGDGVGVTFDDEGHVLLLQAGQDYLYAYDLFARTEERLLLSAPPRAVGTLPDGTTWVAQDAAFGLLTFLTRPEPREVGGFALLGLDDAIGLTDAEAP